MVTKPDRGYKRAQCALKQLEAEGDFQDQRCCGGTKKQNVRTVQTLKRLTKNEGKHSAGETKIRLNNSLNNPVCEGEFIID